jgi:hypothetical protein
MEQQQATFSGWALVELMGHQREAGFVTTQYFGDKAMFQIDVPEIAEREETLGRPKWAEDGIRLLPVGSVISRSAIEGRTRLVNPSAVYAINPATEEAVRSAVAASERRTMKVISVPEGTHAALAAPQGEIDGYDDDPVEQEDEHLPI